MLRLRFCIVFIEMMGLWTGGARADVWQFLFGLSGDNTAYDFMSAPIKREVEWETEMCNDGEFLNRIDWICGFENNDDVDKVVDCFSSIVRRAPPWVKLDTIRKFCGVSLATFTGNETLGLAFQVADPKRCTKEGGTWGIKSKVSVPGISG